MEDFAKIKGLYISALNNDVDIALVENMGEKYHNTRPIKVGDDDQNSINRIHLYVSCGCSRWCRFCLNGYLYRPIMETSVERLVDIA